MIRQHTILVRRKPRPARLPPRQILRVDDWSDAVTDREDLSLLAYSDDFTSGVVAWDAVGRDGPGIAAVGDVGVAVVEGDGVDFDDDLGGGEGEGERFRD